MVVSHNNRIKKVLIANRGEIALRVQRSCRKLGIASAITVSDTDKTSFFARQADEAVIIGGNSAKDSYLNIEKLLKAARDTGADAVHPGYGFLSENAEFVRAVEGAGLVFIGPRAECIEILGNKTEARKRALAKKVPCTPGSPAELSDGQLVQVAKEIGYPVIIKAVAGGGGRGMRIVAGRGELLKALPLARAEAGKNFSDERVYIEKYIERPRHIEVQIFGDNYSNVVHFGTRECSAQRRHQKLIEEAPAVFISDKLRSSLHQAAVRVAESVNYNNAGTAEFLVKDDRFYFLEMNTRIQVEHPVTEEVTGVDLVELQIRVARGERLPFKQKDIKFKGHAIEFRIYAEDPVNQFRPSIGEITKLKRPEAPYIREEYAFESGDVISPYYDAMISKLIVTGRDKEEAVGRSQKALSRYETAGISTNTEFHRWLLKQGEFVRSELDIAWVEREFSPESLRRQKASEVRDPIHKILPGGPEYREYVVYKSKKYDFDYQIESIHRADGTFVLIPLSDQGERARPPDCRRSNGFYAAFNSLAGEVLEVKSPRQIFRK